MSLERFTSGEFHGRDDEIKTLKGIAHSATRGNATSILISGSKGIGKTELLKQLFTQLSTDQDKVIPFWYTVNPALLSLRDFSGDYLTRFIHQTMAFLKKDPSIMHNPFYSPEEIRPLTEDSEMRWAVRVIDEYSGIMKKADPVRAFRYSISVPYRCYLSTGRPVIVMIDDFDRLKELSGDNRGATPDCWMHMEEFINNPYTPHIITGFREELYDMLFNKTSIGEHLELMNLKGIDRESSSRLFESLCNTYNLNVIKTPEMIERFKGNPLYIRKFVNALRRHGNMLHEDYVQRVYLDEIARGEIFIYWISHLKRYVPEDLRADSLNLLYHLCSDPLNKHVTVLQALSVVNEERLYEVLGRLRLAGVIEEGFSTFRLIDDRVFVDVIKSLYQTEVLKDPRWKGKRRGVEIRHEATRKTDEGTFEVTIPAIEGSETVAIRVLEEVARKYNVPSEIVGKLQIAIAELLNTLFILNGSVTGRCYVRFSVEDGLFLVEVDVPLKDLFIEGPDGEASFKLIKEIIDDIKIEKLQGLTRLRMIKRFGGNPAHTPFL
jgi:hypothetical protein